MSRDDNEHDAGLPARAPTLGERDGRGISAAASLRFNLPPSSLKIVVSLIAALGAGGGVWFLDRSSDSRGQDTTVCAPCLEDRAALLNIIRRNRACAIAQAEATNSVHADKPSPLSCGYPSYFTWDLDYERAEEPVFESRGD